MLHSVTFVACHVLAVSKDLISRYRLPFVAMLLMMGYARITVNELKLKEIENTYFLVRRHVRNRYISSGDHMCD